jgi:steroid delta-isomerase
MSEPVDLQLRLERYAAFFAELGPDRLDRLGEHFAQDVRFKDPFNEVRGLDGLRGVFAHMYERLEDPRFRVHRTALSGREGFIHWTFEFAPSGWLRRMRPIDGLSRVRFDETGRVVEHVDYWDPAEQIYGRLPLVGALFRGLRSLFGAAPGAHRR